jgi:purine-binding chemotaxis protein CheW
MMDMQSIRRRAKGAPPPAPVAATLPTAPSVEHKHTETKTSKPAPEHVAPEADVMDEFLFAHDRHSTPSPSVPIVEGHRHLAFTLGEETYAVDIMEIREILKLYAVTPVPRSPPGVLGVISKRGVVMPVYDLAAIVGLRAAATDRHHNHRVLVAGQGDRICGLRIDAIDGVIELSGSLEPIPASVGGRTAAVLRGLGRRDDERMAIVVDVPRVLTMLAGES